MLIDTHEKRWRRKINWSYFYGSNGNSVYSYRFIYVLKVIDSEDSNLNFCSTMNFELALEAYVFHTQKIMRMKLYQREFSILESELNYVD